MSKNVEDLSASPDQAQQLLTPTLQPLFASEFRLWHSCTLQAVPGRSLMRGIADFGVLCHSQCK